VLNLRCQSLVRLGSRYVKDEDGRGIHTVANRAYPLFAAACAIGVVVITNVRDRYPGKTLAGVGGVLFFVASIVHHLCARCRVRFEGRNLVASSGAFLGKKRVEHLVSDIERFVALDPDVVDDDFLRLYLVTRGGTKIPLPFALDGATSAEPKNAERVVEELGVMLESVRRESLDYRGAS
jgi:hypothetical protein